MSKSDLEIKMTVWPLAKDLVNLEDAQEVVLYIDRKEESGYIILNGSTYAAEDIIDIAHTLERDMVSS